MTAPADLICFSHLRWDFVHRRPQELLSRAARDRRVYYIEEPEFQGDAARMTLHPTLEGVVVVRLTLPSATDATAIPRFLRDLVDDLQGDRALDAYVLWCSTPRAIHLARDLRPIAVVYDRFDEAPSQLAALEQQLRVAADLVFTPGPDPYETSPKERNHYAFPGESDITHFAAARTALEPPTDQPPGRRVGFFGLIDERLDLELVDAVAQLRPDLQIVMVGPQTRRVPRRTNLCWCGPRPYETLPAYVAGWDAAILPLVVRPTRRPHNAHRIPEYLAAGRPVAVTAVPGLVEPYRALELVRVANTPIELSRAIDDAVREDPQLRLARADRWLATLTWDQTWQGMDGLISAAVAARKAHRGGLRAV